MRELSYDLGSAKFLLKDTPWPERQMGVLSASQEADLVGTELSRLKNADLSLSWQTKPEIGQLLFGRANQERISHKQAVGLRAVGSMGQAQQFSNLMDSVFTEDVPDRIDDEVLEYFQIGVALLTQQNIAVQYALSRHDGITSLPVDCLCRSAANIGSGFC